MHKMMNAAALAAALSVAPVIALAAAQTTPPAASSAKRPAAKPAVATKSTSGVVKSMDATTLVITHQGKKAAEETFTLDPSTQKEGNVQVGATVSVHYKTEGKTKMATAIMAQQPKAQAAHKPAEKK
ncbi:MAG TPA: hypothetical protein VFJ02_25670 [Vicinamibacterales bacterium]|nr:hypothetical protein [Vicinamibacterales bacterium]